MGLGITAVFNLHGDKKQIYAEIDSIEQGDVCLTTAPDGQKKLFNSVVNIAYKGQYVSREVNVPIDVMHWLGEHLKQDNQMLSLTDKYKKCIEKAWWAAPYSANKFKCYPDDRKKFLDALSAE